MSSEIYKLKPTSSTDGIPVFSPSDRYSENYERIASDHLKVFEEEGRNPFQSEAIRFECEQSTAELVRLFTTDGQAILDVGCGMGTLLEAFPNLKRYGMDISASYLRYAMAKGLEVCWARIEDMPYVESLFDVAVCTDVLEHVLDLNSCFARILSVVKPGGLVIIRVPYNENLKPYLDPNFPYEWVHLRRFDEWSLRLFVEKTFGCRVVHQTFAGYRAWVPRIGRTLPKFGAVVRLVMKMPPGADLPSKRPVRAFWRKVFAPTVINVVVQKPANPDLRLMDRP